jgi:hypothetical protein
MAARTFATPREWMTLGSRGVPTPSVETMPAVPATTLAKASLSRRVPGDGAVDSVHHPSPPVERRATPAHRGGVPSRHPVSEVRMSPRAERRPVCVARPKHVHVVHMHTGGVARGDHLYASYVDAPGWLPRLACNSAAKSPTGPRCRSLSGLTIESMREM